MDSRAIQSSLTSLEDRYRQLREIGERRFESWEKEKGEAQKAVEELKQQVLAKAAELEKERKEKVAGVERVKALERELASVVTGERDARAKEKVETQKQFEKLKQLVSAKSAELEKERKERSI